MEDFQSEPRKSDLRWRGYKDVECFLPNSATNNSKFSLQFGCKTPPQHVLISWR